MNFSLNSAQLLLGRPNAWSSSYVTDISDSIYCSNTCALAASGGYVGIGTTNPQYALDVSGETQYSIQNSAMYNNVNGLVSPTSTYLVTPNNQLALSNTWANNNVTWTATASSNVSTSLAYSLFDTSYSGAVSTISNKWSTAGASYSINTPFAYRGTLYNLLYTGLYNTYINTVGTISGEWMQLQASIPLVINSFTFIPAGTYVNASAEFPKTFYICGSTDGATWYPIIKCDYAKLPFAVNAQTTTASITVATSGLATQNGNSNITYYSTASNAYTYFRMAITNVVGNLDTNGGTTGSTPDGYCCFAEWTPIFSLGKQTGPSRTLLYMDTSNINQLDISGSFCLVNSNATSMSVTPNSTSGSAVNNVWVNNNVTWQAIYSSSSITNIANYNWNNLSNGGNQLWQSFDGLYTAGLYTSIKNTQNINKNGSIVTISGEYMQIQSSIPLILDSYQINTLGWSYSLLDRIPGVYSIVASNDAVNWYALQDASFTSAPTSTANSNYVNLFTRSYLVSTIAPTSGVYTSVQTDNSTNTYFTSLNAYTYFRLIVNSTLFRLSPAVTQEWGTSTLFGWNPIFSPAYSAATLSLDSAVSNQLNLGGTLGLVGGITPTYTTPNLTSKQVGYIYTTFIATGFAVTSSGLQETIAVIQNVPPGLWLICYMCAFTTTFTGVRVGTLVGTVRGGSNIASQYLQMPNTDITSVGGSVVYNNTSINTFHLTMVANVGQNATTYAETNSSYFQATRLA